MCDLQVEIGRVAEPAAYLPSWTVPDSVPLALHLPQQRSAWSRCVFRCCSGCLCCLDGCLCPLSQVRLPHPKRRDPRGWGGGALSLRSVLVTFFWKRPGCVKILGCWATPSWAQLLTSARVVGAATKSGSGWSCFCSSNLTD